MEKGYLCISIILKTSSFIDKIIIMGKRIKKLKKIHIHREGIDQLVGGFVSIAAIGFVLWYFIATPWPFWTFIVIAGILYAIAVNFYQCPVRYFNQEDTDGIVVAPADGKIVVIEEVNENTYFHDRRIQISIFMSVTNVHANWFPVDGHVKFVKHFNGNYHKAWLPKASMENDDGTDILCRQIAGAVARRIVTYAKEGEECYIDEHLGFIKLGSRVDIFLPIDSEVCVKMNQKTVGDQTIIAKLKK